MRTAHLIQPGRVGDVIICLPIAKYYHDKGYRVVWYINESYASLFDYVSYVEVKVLKSNLGGCVGETYSTLKKANGDIVLDLAIGFSGHPQCSSWVREGLHFDQWKYKKAGVDINRKYLLEFNRNYKKEIQLRSELGLNGEYIVVHQTSSFDSYNFNIVGAVEVKPVEGYTILDWCGILEEAGAVYCVDSSVLNLVNQMGFCKNNRSVRLWSNRNSLLSPVLEEGWNFMK